MRYFLAPAVATVLYAFFARHYKIGFADSVFFAGILWLLAAAIYLGKKIMDKEEKVIKNKLQEKESHEIEFNGKLEKISREKAYLDKKLAGLSKLYTVSKKMSFNVRFIELFESVKSFLEDNFEFRSFKIILFKNGKNKGAIDRVYEIKTESAGYATLSRPQLDLTAAAIKLKKSMFLERGTDLFDFETDPEGKNILIIPLMVERKIIAVLLLENIKKDDHDRFSILASQIALQIERIELFDEVEKLSITDGLTGTFLRRYFYERFKEELARAEQLGIALSFIMVDLDKFKRCNDTFGHLVGDVVLKEVSAILKKNVREIDLVGRFGGEEFCVLLPETKKEGALIVSERTRKAVQEKTIKAYDESVRITISMGVSSFPEDSKHLNELVENADKALYEAKKKGRNKVCSAS